MVTMAKMEPACFGSNSMYCPVVWLILPLAGCLHGSSLGIVPMAAQNKRISYEILHLPLNTWWKKSWVLIKPLVTAGFPRGLISVGCMPGVLLGPLLCSRQCGQMLAWETSHFREQIFPLWEGMMGRSERM